MTHTFARWLEMRGALFRSAEYYFAENSSIGTLVHRMQQVKPTIFISITKKWQQFYEHITVRVEEETYSKQLIQQVVNQPTGRTLRWGLSAAGFHVPRIYWFFQKYAIELLNILA